MLPGELRISFLSFGRFIRIDFNLISRRICSGLSGSTSSEKSSRQLASYVFRRSSVESASFVFRRSSLESASFVFRRSSVESASGSVKIKVKVNCSNLFFQSFSAGNLESSF
ncbi:hypothetical protein AVEN_181312-1 [Araneus ventricosus]|uniref:Uncharacterized protein n=1 Tax=Araneus ventricosus TaxID=182803 RepID=A0A4Y2EJ24_ARAVE|nr:hypothetical protein AVEN_181312-1 [Araneus ventricosus]